MLRSIVLQALLVTIASIRRFFETLHSKWFGTKRCEFRNRFWQTLFASVFLPGWTPTNPPTGFAFFKQYASQGPAKNGWCVHKLRELVLANIRGITRARSAKSPLTIHWSLDLNCHTYWKQLWVPDWALFQNPRIPMHGSGCTTLGLTQLFSHFELLWIFWGSGGPGSFPRSQPSCLDKEVKKYLVVVHVVVTVVLAPLVVVSFRREAAVVSVVLRFGESHHCQHENCSASGSKFAGFVFILRSESYRFDCVIGSVWN